MMANISFRKYKLTGLNATDPATAKSFGGEYSKEAKELLAKRRAKISIWKRMFIGWRIGRMDCANVWIEDPIDSKKIKSHLTAVHKYNLKENLSDHANPQRPSFALGDEGGLLIMLMAKRRKTFIAFCLQR